MTLAALLALQDYYPMREGHVWTYAVEIDGRAEELKKSVVGKETIGGRECLVIEDEGFKGHLRKQYVRRTADSVELVRARIEIRDPVVWLRLPPKKADTWTSRLLTPREEDGGSLTFEVKDEEEVEVPAGKFKAWRIELTGVSGENRMTATLWLAPDTGEVRRTVKVVEGGRTLYDMDLRLKAFRR
jgi:hypothetical protein